jgi:hypothetical protein
MTKPVDPNRVRREARLQNEAQTRLEHWKAENDKRLRTEDKCKSCGRIWGCNCHPDDIDWLLVGWPN